MGSTLDRSGRLSGSTEHLISSCQPTPTPRLRQILYSDLYIDLCMTFTRPDMTLDELFSNLQHLISFCQPTPTPRLRQILFSDLYIDLCMTFTRPDMTLDELFSNLQHLISFCQPTPTPRLKQVLFCDRYITFTWSLHDLTRPFHGLCTTLQDLSMAFTRPYMTFFLFDTFPQIN